MKLISLDRTNGCASNNNEIITLSLTLSELISIKEGSIEPKLYAQLQVISDLAGYGYLSSIGLVAEKSNVVSQEYLTFKILKESYDKGYLTDEQLKEAEIELKAKEGIE